MPNSIEERYLILKERVVTPGKKRGWWKKRQSKLVAATGNRKRITTLQLLQLKHKQNDSCMICEEAFVEKKGGIHIDHCHRTGIIRGLLCRKCNVGIGMFRENQRYLENAIFYLKRFEDA